MRIHGRLRLLAALLAAACSSDPTGGGDILVVSQIDIQPPGASIIVGATQQFSATPKTSSGITVPNRPVTWSSSDLGIATVSTSGLVTGVAVGPATITAHVDDVTADVSVNITPKPVASVSVEPAQATLTMGSTQQLLATPRDAQGQALQDRPVTFQSDNPAVASVSVTGLVTAVAVGVTTIRATSEGRTGTSAITVTPRPAARVAFTTQPANGIAGQALPTIRVAVQDEQGGTISDAVTPITLAIADNAGGSTLSGTTTVNAVAGVATFSNVRLDKAGSGYTLRATAAPLSPALSTAFNIAAGAATRLIMATQPPASAQSGVPLSGDPVVRLVDANGNPVAQAGVEISVQIVGTGATLAGDLSVPTVANGTATFSDLTLTGSGGSYTLRFLASGLTEVVSSPIMLTSLLATGLVLKTPPSSTAQSSVPFAQQPVIQLRDDNNNAVQGAGVPVTASVATGGGTLLGTATVLTDALGQATFTNLGISGAPGSRTLVFSSPGLTSVTSGAITLTAGPATKLGLTTQPPAAAGFGVAFAQQPVVQIQDADGNPVAQAGAAITATIETGTGTLGGTTVVVTSASGQAVFTNLSLTGPAGAYTLRFSATGLAHVISTSITLGAGTPTKLFISTPPSASVQNGKPFPQQPSIQVVDAGGNPAAQAGVVVTVSIQSGNPALSGALTATTNVAGLATFTDLVLTGALGDRTLTFAAAGLTSVTSGTITVTPGDPSALTITTQPSSAAQNDVAFPAQPVIQVTDAGGNPVSSSGIVVTANIASGGGALGGTVTATTNGSGVATFTDLKITGTVGARTLSFSAPSLSSVTSGSVSITAGIATRIVIVTPPPASVASGATLAATVVGLQDVSSNNVDSAGVDIDVAIGSGGGTLGGTTQVATDANGHATFSDLTITGTIGDRTLSFTSGGLSGAASGTISVTAGALDHLVWVQTPAANATDGIPLAQQPIVGARDLSDNPIAGVSIAATGSGLGGTTTVVTNGSGDAAFTDLVITGSPGTVTLTFSAAGAGPLAFDVTLSFEQAAAAAWQFLRMARAGL